MIKIGLILAYYAKVKHFLHVYSNNLRLSL